MRSRFQFHYDAERERAEDAAADAQDKLNAEVDAELSKRTPAELQREAIQAYEDRERLRYLPIGTTIESAKKKGWITE